MPHSMEASRAAYFLPALTAALVTSVEMISVARWDKEWEGHTSASLLGLGDGLDDTNSDGLTHVTDGETAKGWVVSLKTVSQVAYTRVDPKL